MEKTQARDSSERSVRSLLGVEELREADRRARAALPAVFSWTKLRYAISVAVVFYVYLSDANPLSIALGFAWLIGVIEIQGLPLADVWFYVFRPDKHPGRNG